MTQLLTLKPGRWYAMTMYPGYADSPYHSPIEVQSIKPLGNRLFELQFWNPGYAAGVQMMEKTFRTLGRHPGSLITQEQNSKERTTIFEPLTGTWIGAFVPRFSEMLIQAVERQQTFSQYHAR